MEVEQATTRKLVTLAWASAGLFIVLAVAVVLGWTSSVDIAVLKAVHAMASPAFDAIVLVLTNFGKPVVAAAVAVILAAVLFAQKRVQPAVIMACGVLGSGLVAYIVKLLVERTRPDLWTWLVTETGYSFPSGHATASAALVLCGIVLLWHAKWRRTALVVGGVYVACIAFTRLYLGVHYPSDILGGWLLSFAWVTAVVALATTRRAH